MKKGFTLSEILITIGIVGVVSAIVVPNISAKITRNTIGSSLARAVELTETGMANIIQTANDRTDEANISTIDSITQDDLVGNGSNAFITADLFGNVTRSFLGVDGPINGYTIPNQPNNPQTFKFKKMNAYITFINVQPNPAFGNNNAINRDTVVFQIYLDANGADLPNELGKDIFLFGLTDSGHLVPAGSGDYNNNVMNSNVGLFATVCNGDTIPNNDGDRLACAARVVNDGYRINYNY